MNNIQKLKQTKLAVVNVDEKNDSLIKRNALNFKLDGQIYPWRRKAKP